MLFGRWRNSREQTEANLKEKRCGSRWKRVKNGVQEFIFKLISELFHLVKSGKTGAFPHKSQVTSMCQVFFSLQWVALSWVRRKKLV